jgi:hypothetical protein
MSRGLGDLQRRIKELMNRAAAELDMPSLMLPHIYYVLGAAKGRLSVAQTRSIRRALKNLVDRGDVLIVQGTGKSGDPYAYTTVETWAGAAEGGKPLTDTAKAKQITAEMFAELQKAKF